MRNSTARPRRSLPAKSTAECAKGRRGSRSGRSVKVVRKTGAGWRKFFSLGAVDVQLDLAVATDRDAADHAAGHAGSDRARRDVAVHEGAGADDRLLADRDPLRDHALAADVAAIADRHRRARVRRLASRQSPLDRVVRVDLHARADAAEAADGQAAGAVEQRERADPRPFADGYVAVDVAARVDARSFPKA